MIRQHFRSLALLLLVVGPVSARAAASSSAEGASATSPAADDGSSRAPVASFATEVRAGVVPLEVPFVDRSTGAISSWSWDFGDGTGSSEPSPVHEYVTPGTFTVRLTVTGPDGADSTSFSGLVRVASPPAPKADFSGTPTAGDAPLSVSFADLSTGGVSAWSWSFGDGSASTAAAPSHTYAKPGRYTVSLTVIGPSGVDSTTRVDLVTVAAPSEPRADFVADVVEGFAPLTVRFSDLSAGHVSSWSWSFGDGGAANAEEPTHVFDAPGQYSVVLTVGGLGGRDTASVPALIDVRQLPVTELRDGGFELQTTGAAPEAPWVVVAGSAHAIHPDDAPRDDGMPVTGSNWLEVSAQGTIDARPPSRPGGATRPAVGGAGVMQEFLVPAGRSVIELAAAFLLDGDPGLAGFNDWMSIDVSDGVTTYNLFYRDSFADFQRVSKRYGLAMTAVERVRADLALLFPESTPFTPLTLAIQVGNGGDSLAPSRGYVDDIRFVAPIQSVVRYGCGTNPVGSLTVLGGEPSIGKSMTLGIDNPLGTQGESCTSVVLVSFDPDPSYPCGTLVDGFNMSGAGRPGELLVGLAEPNPVVVIVGQPWTTPGVPAVVRLQVPNNPLLLGQVVFVQGYLLDQAPHRGMRIGLTDALALAIGR